MNTRHRYNPTLFIGLLCLWCPAPLLGQNLLLNGSFESTSGIGFGNSTVYSGDSTSISGWTVGGDSVDDHSNPFWRQDGLDPSNSAYDGTNVVDLDGYSSGSISQSFQTTPGQIYRLFFAYSRNIYHPEIYATNPSSALVTVDGIGSLIHYPFTSSVPGPALIWTPVDLTFTANSDTTTIQFASSDPPGYLGGVLVDAASVTAIPEPTSLLMLSMGSVGLWLSRVGHRRNRPDRSKAAPSRESSHVANHSLAISRFAETVILIQSSI